MSLGLIKTYKDISLHVQLVLYINEVVEPWLQVFLRCHLVLCSIKTCPCQAVLIPKQSSLLDEIIVFRDRKSRFNCQFDISYNLNLPVFLTNRYFKLKVYLTP